jgi:hypothetical protein
MQLVHILPLDGAPPPPAAAAAALLSSGSAASDGALEGGGPPDRARLAAASAPARRPGALSLDARAFSFNNRRLERCAGGGLPGMGPARAGCGTRGLQVQGNTAPQTAAVPRSCSSRVRPGAPAAPACLGNASNAPTPALHWQSHASLLQPSWIPRASLDRLPTNGGPPRARLRPPSGSLALRSSSPTPPPASPPCCASC